MRNEYIEDQLEAEGGFTIEIHYDFDPQDPRKDENVGTMVCWHDRSNLGDRQLNRRDGSIDDFVNEAIRKNYLIMPLWLYEHSMMTMRAGEAGFGRDGIPINGSGNPFHDPWDSGQVGFIYCTKAQIRKEWGTKPDAEGKTPLERAIAYLEGEVELYDMYLKGEVYGFVIKDVEGEEVDSCWGFYGDESVKEAALEAAGYALSQQQKEIAEKLAGWPQATFIGS